MTQLELLGLDETVRRAEIGRTPQVRSRLTKQINGVHDLLAEMPTIDDLGFLHSGLCQTCLPHAKLETNHAYWRRESGNFTLLITPGILDDQGLTKRSRRSTEENEAAYVGVPYGPKARLIMIHLQTEGLKSRTVSLGSSLSDFLRSLGLTVSGGKRGSIAAVREQCLRIARCQFSLQWTARDSDGGSERLLISDTKIVEGLELWNRSDDNWSGIVELSERFHDHLRQHAVPLDKRGIAFLSGNSMGLDLYTLFAYRLPKLNKDLFLTWEMLQSQIGADTSHNALARKIREVMPHVLTAYPHAKVEISRHGLLLRPSKAAVPKTVVNGLRILDAP